MAVAPRCGPWSCPSWSPRAKWSSLGTLIQGIRDKEIPSRFRAGWSRSQAPKADGFSAMVLGYFRELWWIVSLFLVGVDHFSNKNDYVGLPWSSDWGWLPWWDSHSGETGWLGRDWQPALPVPPVDTFQSPHMSPSNTDWVHNGMIIFRPFTPNGHLAWEDLPSGKQT